VNSTVSYYDGGAMASFLLDLELRSKTGNAITLDTLMREMYRRFPESGPGFATQDLIEIASTLASTRFEKFFERFISGVEPYPFEDVLNVVGLELSLGTAAEHDATKAYIGLNVQDVNGMPNIRAVLSDGPAYLAGICAGDEILTLNGRRFASADVIHHIESRFKPGDAVQLQLMRRNRLRTFSVSLGSRPSGRCQLRRVKDPTVAQKNAYASWLNQGWA
jgi:predicted metalloprotease with PDZ domain